MTVYNLENYSKSKNKFFFSNGSILEINNNYNNRSRRNLSFTELYKFGLRGNLERINEMCVVCKNKHKKVTEMKVV